MDKPHYYDMDEFVKSNEYKRLKEMAISQNLVLFPYEYGHGESFLRDAGSYIIICPNEKFKRDLRDRVSAFPKLMDERRALGITAFNPCYQIIDFTEYDKGNNAFSLYMETMEAIENSSVVINAFRELGYDDYPDWVAKETADEIKDLNLKRHDLSLPYETRQRFEKTFKGFVGYAYDKYMKCNGRLYRPLVTGQVVGKEYFSENDITAVTDRINQHFKPFFLERVKDYPDFYFAIDSDKPAVKAKGLNGLLSIKGKDPFKDNKEVTEWNITFPYGKRDTFYKIMTEFNTRNLEMSYPYPESVGEIWKLETIRMSLRDMNTFDALCKQYGIKYYINHGDMEFMSNEAAMNPLIAFHQDDRHNVLQIANYIANNLPGKAFLTEEEAREAMKKIDTKHENFRKNNTVVGEPHDERRKSFAGSYGYSDLTH